MNELNELIEDFQKRKRKIRKRLKEFKLVWQESDQHLFRELCFCICAVQTKSRMSDKAITLLHKNKLLYKGDQQDISKGLHRIVRFHNNKARYIIENRDKFFDGKKFLVRDHIDPEDILGSRLWLWKNIKGFGIKEASHYLRNLGLGEDLAILDVHILNNMKKYGIVKRLPKSLTPRKYFTLEKKLKKFSRDTEITMGELDILFWSRNTGEIFK